MAERLTFTVGVNAAQIAQAQAVLDPKQYKVAMQAAVSRTLTTGRARAARIAGESLNLRIGDIKKLFTVKRPSYNRLEGFIHIARKAAPLVAFKPTQKKAGVAVRVWKGQPRELLRGTFLLEAKRGRGVVERLRSGSEGKSGKRAKRLPVHSRQGPTVIAVFLGSKKHKGQLDPLAIDLSETLAKNIDSQISRFTK